MTAGPVTSSRYTVTALFPPQSMADILGDLYLMSATLLASMVMFLRLRKRSVGLFGAYLAGGVLYTILLTVAAEPKPYVDVRVTMLAGMPLAIAVLAYMLRLKRRAVLA